MSKSKKHTPALGADYGERMKNRYAEKVKPSVKTYTKADRRENHVVEDWEDEAQTENKSGKTHQGGCLCGAVRFTVKGHLRPVINCHCGQCCHTHGHYGAYSSARKNNVKFVNESGLKWFRSSNEARRGFCQECGGSLFFERIGGETISIAAGMFDGPTGLETSGHIYFADKPDYYEIEDDLPKFPQASGGNLEGDSEQIRKQIKNSK